MNRPFTVSGRLRRVRWALRGLGIMLKRLASRRLDGGRGRGWAGVAVWRAEGLNTALELLADATSPVFHPLIGKAKDVAAGAVLLAALGAVIIGVLIFGPRLLQASTHARMG